VTPNPSLPSLDIYFLLHQLAQFSSTLIIYYLLFCEGGQMLAGFLAFNAMDQTASDSAELG
jgi:hypothetical protein